MEVKKRPWAFRALCRILCEGLLVSVILIITAWLIWIMTLASWFKIDIVHGQFGSYGQIELPDVLKHDTEILEFSAVRVPSRILYTIPILERLEVRVTYRNADKKTRFWERTYLEACDNKGDCKPTTWIRGVLLWGALKEGGTKFRKYLYFKSARPGPEKAVPGPKPKDIPSFLPAVKNSEK